jgi:L-rhamnose isomerase
MSSIQDAYKYAAEKYAELGVDVEQALKKLEKISISVHCWQGDDVGGFERPDSSMDGGGIQVTGNYPGKARTVNELRQDLEKMYSLVPGNHRLSLHAIYGEFGGKLVDRDKIGPEHFKGWVSWAAENNVKLDFNATCFSHPKAESNFTLSSKDSGIRNFWIEHVKRAREISEYIGKQQGNPCIHNLWVPDGFKDYPADRFGHRSLLKDSLDKIYETDYTNMKDAIESKLFGIGIEAYTVGSHEFYLGYALKNNKMVCLDLGHFHPTELIADKISSVFQFTDEMLLHVSRPMRWDSDHVVILNDDIRMLCEEIVRSDRLDNIYIGLDFFDATINRMGAWTTGVRTVLKGLLIALLEPYKQLLEYEEKGNYFARLALMEQLKTMPFGAVWDYYCSKMNAPEENGIIENVLQYEKEVLGKRV